MYIYRWNRPTTQKSSESEEYEESKKEYLKLKQQCSLANIKTFKKLTVIESSSSKKNPVYSFHIMYRHICFDCITIQFLLVVHMIDWEYSYFFTHRLLCLRRIH